MFTLADDGGEGTAAAASADDDDGGATETVQAYTPPDNAETFAFDAQVDKMLHIVVNSLYQHNEVFLRELISNASDALDKIRYLLLSEPDSYKPKDKEDDIPLEVQIEYDAEHRTLTVRDTGVGMTHDDLVKNLGTVARSGTTKFIESLKESGNADATISQIGQFGVGFYSAFLVADRITVASKSPLEDTQYVWESQNGASDFVIYPDPRGKTLRRGTEITLHLKDDAIEFTDGRRLKDLAHHYSEFVIYPISLRITSTEVVEVEDEEEAEADEKKDDEKKDEEDDLEVTDDEEDKEDEEEKPKKTKEVTTHSWEVINNNPAIWTRDKEEITDTEYQAFYKVLAGDESKEAEKWVHFNAEGNINFKSILYLPKEVPENYRYGNIDIVPGAMRLYVRKVLIGQDFSLLPKYLQFIKGMVDSDDLPLNVNRETLQESKILQVIRKKVVRKAIDLISSFAKESEADALSAAEEELEDEDEDKPPKDEVPKYHEWYSKFSPNIKLGVIEDEPNRAKLMKLLRYQTSQSFGNYISLGDYVKNMKEWQKDIYVIGGTSVEELEQSPFLEAFREKDVEVIYLIDPVDEYLVQTVRQFDGKNFVQASGENVDFKDEDADLVKRRQNVYKKKFKPLTDWLRTLYSGSIYRVQVSKRSLGNVPAIVTSSSYGNSANMERILRAQAFQAQNVDPRQFMAMKVLEINPRHPIVLKLLEGCPPEEKKKDKKKKKKDGDDVAEDEKEEEEEEPPFEVAEETIDAAWLVHDMAMLNGGFPISDPVAHTHRLMHSLQQQLGLESLQLEPEIDPPVEDDVPPDFDMDDLAAQMGAMGMNAEDFNMDDLDMDDLDLDDVLKDVDVDVGGGDGGGDMGEEL